MNSLLAPLVLAVFLSSIQGWAGSCQTLGQILKTYPNLSEDASFWEEFGKMDVKDGKALNELAEKFASKETRGTALRSSTTIEESLAPPMELDDSAFHFSSQVAKSYKKLDANLKEKFNEFLETVNKPGGLKDLANNSGRWGLEKLNESDEWAVRLNRHYRVTFETQNGTTVVTGLGKDIYNH